MHVDEFRLRRLVTVFLEENKKLNLSAFRTEEHCWVGNVLDSIAVIEACTQVRGVSKPTTLIDIGTGGGFPLLPLAVTWPETRCIGIDSIAKKISAVRRIASALELKNVMLLSGRVEELASSDDYRETADMVTARAVAPLPVLLEYAVPLLKVGGVCAFWKSSRIADELSSSASAQKILSAPLLGEFDYELPGGFGKRIILFFKKTAATKADYPRKTGIPKSKPL